LVEREWLVTLSALDADDIEYTEFVECGRELVKTLREEEVYNLYYIILFSQKNMNFPNISFNLRR